jgi:hypothetical protein
MKEVRNIQGKLVCRIDEEGKIVEIAVKGCITVIRFSEDGKVSVINTTKAV